MVSSLRALPCRRTNERTVGMRDECTRRSLFPAVLEVFPGSVPQPVANLHSWCTALPSASCLVTLSDGMESAGIVQVPTQLSRLNNGIHHAKVVVTPKAPGGWPLMPLPATFAFVVRAGGPNTPKRFLRVLIQRVSPNLFPRGWAAYHGEFQPMAQAVFLSVSFDESTNRTVRERGPR